MKNTIKRLIVAAICICLFFALASCKDDGVKQIDKNTLPTGDGTDSISPDVSAGDNNIGQPDDTTNTDDTPKPDDTKPDDTKPIAPAVPDINISDIPPAPEVMRSTAYDTRVSADELILSNGIRLGMNLSEVVAYSGAYEKYKPQPLEIGGGKYHICVNSPGDTYILVSDPEKNGHDDYVLSSVTVGPASSTEIFRGIKPGDTIESVFEKIPSKDTQLKEWKEQYLYGYEKTDPKGYAELRFILDSYSSNYQIDFYTPQWIVCISFDRYALTVDQITVHSAD